MVSVSINSVTFELKAEHDFSWLKSFGTVFAVFDQQDSGNICFGVAQAGVKRFIKYAGAKTVAYSGDPQTAVVRLKNAVPNYRVLKHPDLVDLVEGYQIGNGYAVVFDWFRGECLHSYWLFPPSEKYSNPASPNYRFNHLEIGKRLNCFGKIVAFHQFVETKGYVAIDFYDGCILYDFETDVMKICDIDFYAQKPYLNPLGRMWGSKRFMSPEEFELGALIDEKTNVFSMGAIAFSIFGGTLDRSIDQWVAGDSLYQVALKAASNNRDQRYASVTEFCDEWNKALR